ncbi:acyl carrier protein [Floricoccus penangensis]|uniref:Acyl carrier protein n=1 Tax=Floricoccus penangensis TaxID=1859475 RepID=A0A9Q5JI47_9LACT|nr:acyl carrier protein [Floricoccus penangensis]OFI47995.1 acyl carrier protein [Floricoccus penangensis]URZ87524.1 acyl carrier protein [Floricoccus penangensis]
MTKEEIFNQIKDTLAESLEIEPDQITLETDIVDDLHADSISIMEFTLALEDEFDIEISDEDADRIITIGNVVDYIAEQKA